LPKPESWPKAGFAFALPSPEKRGGNKRENIGRPTIKIKNKNIGRTSKI